MYCHMGKNAIKYSIKLLTYVLSQGKKKPKRDNSVPDLAAHMMAAMPPRWDTSAKTLNLQDFVQDAAFGARNLLGGFNNVGFCATLAEIIKIHCSR